MRFQPLVPLISFVTLASTRTLRHSRSNSQELDSPAQVHLIHQFPNPTWVENIAVRKNGQLLLTTITGPDLYLVDPSTPALGPTFSKTATLVHSFPPELSVLGITELQPDQFYVIVGNFSLSPVDLGLGTYSVWSVDLQKYNPISNTGATTKEVSALTQASLLNGMSTFDVSKDLVIVSDSIKGAVWVVNVQTGDYKILLQEPEMAPPANKNSVLGINGVRVLPSGDIAQIYFSNTGTATFYRVPVSRSTLQKTGPVEVVASDVVVDDFALDIKDGNAYLAGAADNALLRVPLKGGDVETIYGGVNETVLPGPTSVVVGRGWSEKGMLYVTTNGGLMAPVNGNYTEGGKVVEVEIDC